MDHFDGDKDGRLGPDEIEAMLSMSSGVDIAKIDTDADGYVTHEELRASLAAQMGSGER
jgi:Ca2+-binding EF-hand superfamily protein